eukprot:COSAG06_NODE_55127_length_291_cov_0.760417_1_plen_20_part_01
MRILNGRRCFVLLLLLLLLL